MRAAKREGDGLTKSKPITEKQAVDRLRRGEDVHTKTRSEAKRLQRKASGKKPLKPERHGEDGDGYYKHVHDKDRDGGHAFYGDPE